MDIDKNREIQNLKKEIAELRLQETRNINKIKRLESADNRLKLVLSSSGIGIIDYFLPISYHLYHCPETAKILGYEDDENFLFDQDIEWFYSQIHSDDLNKVIEIVSRFKKKKYNEVIFEFRFKHKSGKWIYLKIYSIVLERDKNNKIKRILGVIENISDQKKIDYDLKQSEQRYHGIFENSPLSLWEEDWSDVCNYLNKLRSTGVTDFHQYFLEHHQAVEKCISLVKILDINQKTLQLHEANNKKDLLSNLKDVFTDVTAENFIKELVAFANGDLYYQSENIHRTIKGNSLNIKLQMNVVPGYEKDLGKVIVSMMDITEKKNIENERDKALLEYDKLEKSHRDLENIISICYSCNLVRVDANFNEKIIEYLQKYSNAEFTHYVCPECRAKMLNQNSIK